MDDYLDIWVKFNEKLFDVKQYKLTMDELMQLCRDFQADCYDGFVSNDHSYIEYWLEKNWIDEEEV